MYSIEWSWKSNCWVGFVKANEPWLLNATRTRTHTRSKTPALVHLWTTNSTCFLWMTFSALISETHSCVTFQSAYHTRGARQKPTTKILKPCSYTVKANINSLQIDHVLWPWGQFECWSFNFHRASKKCAYFSAVLYVDIHWYESIWW